MLLVFIYFYKLIVITINLLSFINIYIFTYQKKKKTYYHGNLKK